MIESETGKDYRYWDKAEQIGSSYPINMTTRDGSIKNKGVRKIEKFDQDRFLFYEYYFDSI